MRPASLRGEADRAADIAHRLREAIDTVTDPTAAEAKVEAIYATAEQRPVAGCAAAVQAETARLVRADADKMLVSFRVAAARDRDELRRSADARRLRSTPSRCLQWRAPLRITMAPTRSPTATPLPNQVGDQP